MSRICRITPLASKDIEAIADYLAAQSNVTAAENFLNTLDSRSDGWAIKIPDFCGYILSGVATQ